MDELAERFQISLTGMKTCFKEIYGDSMYSYLRRYRMNVAATMLRQDYKKGLRKLPELWDMKAPVICNSFPAGDRADADGISKIFFLNGA